VSDAAITSLSVDELLTLLNQAGAGITLDQLKADIKAGAPQNNDGTINYIHYGAWLLKER